MGTPIEWTDETWNPTRGCTRVSPGCVNCYAERQAIRQRSTGYKGLVTITNGHPAWTGKVRAAGGKTLTAPIHWKRPRRIFVDSMSDLFHEDLPDEAIDRVFAVMALCPQHTFQILTKRPKRMLEYLGSKDADDESMRDRMDEAAQEFEACHADMNPPERWPLPNVWLGISVEDQQRADERIPLLLQTPAAKRFVSYEPALGPVNFNPYVFCVECKEKDGNPGHAGADGEPMCRNVLLDWVIVGGESGPGARPFDIQWARDTIAQCKAAGVACFVKQLGALPFNSKGSYEPKGITSKKGGEMIEWPPDLRVREFPA